MTLITCPACGCAAKDSEERCPECEATLRDHEGKVPRHRAALLLGLTAIAATPLLPVGCGDDSDGAGGDTATSSTVEVTAMSSAVTKYAGPGISSVVASGAGQAEDASKEAEPEPE